jgi:hypothetical protein
VRGPERPLPLRRFLFSFVRNPIVSLPQNAFVESIVVFDSGRAVMVWVTDPALIEAVLLQNADRFTKTDLEKRVFASPLGDGILTSKDSSWRWQRRTAAPLFRPAVLAGAPPPAAVGRSGTFRSRAVPARAPGQHPPHPVHAIRLRPAPASAPRSP